MRVRIIDQLLLRPQMHHIGSVKRVLDHYHHHHHRHPHLHQHHHHDSSEMVTTVPWLASATASVRNTTTAALTTTNFVQVHI